MYIDLQSQFEVLSVSFTCMDTTSVLAIITRSEDDCLKLSARASRNVKNPADEVVCMAAPNRVFFFSILNFPSFSSMVLGSFVKHDQNELDADNILNTGDQIYKKTVEKLKTEGKFTNMLLNFNEIPNTIELNEGKFRIEKKNTLFYVIKPNND
jgi:hypothetical protein